MFTCDVCELLLRSDFDLIEDEYDELLVIGLCFSFFYGDLERLCERPITSLSVEGCLAKTPISGVKYLFLSLLLSAIIW